MFCHLPSFDDVSFHLVDCLFNVCLLQVQVKRHCRRRRRLFFQRVVLVTIWRSNTMIQAFIERIWKRGQEKKRMETLVLSSHVQ